MIFVFLHHSDFGSRERDVWKRMWSRVLRRAQWEGPPTVACIPALGWASFNGKKFNCPAVAGIGLAFSRVEDAVSAIRKLTGVPGLRFWATPGFRPFFGEPPDWRSAAGAERDAILIEQPGYLHASAR